MWWYVSCLNLRYLSWVWLFTKDYIFRSISDLALRKQPDNWMPWHVFLNIQISTHAGPYTTVSSRVTSIIVPLYDIFVARSITKSLQRSKRGALKILFTDYNSCYLDRLNRAGTTTLLIQWIGSIVIFHKELSTCGKQLEHCKLAAREL